MLVLTRKTGETIIIGDDIYVKVKNINNNGCKLRVTVPVGWVVDWHGKPERQMTFLDWIAISGPMNIGQDPIVVQVVQIERSQIRIGIESPSRMEIDREEVRIEKRKGRRGESQQGS